MPNIYARLSSDRHMQRPVGRGFSRLRLSKSLQNQLRHTWKPFPTKEQFSWGQAAMKFLKRKADLRPDAYIRLSELRARPDIPSATLEEIHNWVVNDHLHRFELASELEKVDNEEGWCKICFIRARGRHSIPGVDTTTKRIKNSGDINSLVFATTPENWPSIEKFGLRPETPNLHTPSYSNPNFTYFAQDIATLIPEYFTKYPAQDNAPGNQLVQLHIKIDVVDAMGAGIKFFRNRHGQIISTGSPNRSIPIEFFNSVYVAILKREMLYRARDGKPPLRVNG